MLAQKLKVKKITFYFTIFLIYTGPVIAGYQSIEKKSSFHLMYSTVFYPLWLESGEGKSETARAPVLSILKKIKDYNVFKNKQKEWMLTTNYI